MPVGCYIAFVTGYVKSRPCYKPLVLTLHIHLHIPVPRTTQIQMLIHMHSYDTILGHHGPRYEPRTWNPYDLYNITRAQTSNPRQKARKGQGGHIMDTYSVQRPAQHIDQSIGTTPDMGHGCRSSSTTFNTLLSLPSDANPTTTKPNPKQ